MRLIEGRVLLGFMQVIVADTSALVPFSAIHRLDLLQSIFTKVLIPPAVFQEVVTNGEGWKNVYDLQAVIAGKTWMIVQSMLSRTVPAALQHLGAGEAEALTLAKESNLTVLIDDREGRTTATRHGINVIGSLWVLAVAKTERLISEAKPLIEAMEKAGIYYHPKLKKRFLGSLDEA